MRSIAIVGVDVAVSNIKVFSVAMKMQQWVSIALFSSYTIWRTAVNSNKYSVWCVCVCVVALFTQYANNILSALFYIVICGLFCRTVFFHTIS